MYMRSPTANAFEPHHARRLSSGLDFILMDL